MLLPHTIFVLMGSLYKAKGIMLCDPGWDLFGDNCYKVVRNMTYPVPFATAIQLCNDEHLNATNIMPKTQDETNYMTTEVLIKASKIWIGLTDWNMDGQFVWEDGTNLSTSDFKYWVDLQPDNNDLLDRDENCVGTVLVANGAWSDITCLLNAGVICQYTIQNYETSTSPIAVTTQTLIESVATSEYETTNSETTPLTLEMTSSINQDSTPQKNSTFDYICPCSVLNRTTSYTSTTLEKILNNIKVRKELLSSAIRRKNCASDHRYSSICIGCVGITTLIVSFGFIVFLDCSPKRYSSEKFNTIRKSFV